MAVIKYMSSAPVYLELNLSLPSKVERRYG